MATLRIDTIDFHFKPAIEARKYDEFEYYIGGLRTKGMRAVNVVAFKNGANPKQSWLIEVKDYRIIRGQPTDFAPAQIAVDFFRKVKDTQAGLVEVATNATNPEEKAHLTRALRARSFQIVFHLEPYAGPATKLFPKDPTAGVLQKLRQMFGPMDPPLLVLGIENTRKANVP